MMKHGDARGWGDFTEEMSQICVLIYIGKDNQGTKRDPALDRGTPLKEVRLYLCQTLLPQQRKHKKLN